MTAENDPFLLPDRIQIPNTIGRFKVSHTLHKGKSSVVVFAKDEKVNECVAIKLVKRDEVVKQNMLPYFENELRLSSRFDHPNIVKVHDILYTDDYIMIVMDYLPNGDLRQLLSKNTLLPFDDQLRIIYEILQGLDYLHKRGISHRNISPENILFDKNMTPKLIDFGWSKENSASMHTMCGTPLFIAPEIVLSKNYDGRKADIWSFGVLTHLIASGNFPWNDISEAQYLKIIQEENVEINIEPKGIIGTLIKKALTIDPNQRSTAEALLATLGTTNNSKKIVMSKVQNQKRTASGSFLPRLNVVPPSPVFMRSRLIHDKVVCKIPHCSRSKNHRDV